MPLRNYTALADFDHPILEPLQTLYIPSPLPYSRLHFANFSTPSFMDNAAPKLIGILGERWALNPLPLDSQSSALPIELQSPYSVNIPITSTYRQLYRCGAEGIRTPKLRRDLIYSQASQPIAQHPHVLFCFCY